MVLGIRLPIFSRLTGCWTKSTASKASTTAMPFGAAWVVIPISKTTALTTQPWRG